MALSVTVVRVMSFQVLGVKEDKNKKILFKVANYFTGQLQDVLELESVSPLKKLQVFSVVHLKKKVSPFWLPNIAK